MNAKSLRKSILLLLAAAIWGFAFVAQSVGGDAVGPFAFNFIRFLLGALVLLPVIAVKKAIKKDDRTPKNGKDWKKLIIAGVLCGTALCVASNLQQFGITGGTEVGKAGFLTACYILIVPILGLFFKRKCGWQIWVGVVIALIGLYLLCINPQVGFSVQTSDIYIIICSLCFSIQIMIIDHFGSDVDGVRLSCIEFAVCGLLSFIPTFIFDMSCNMANISSLFTAFNQTDAIISLLYAAIMSTGVAYTLQIIGQDGLNPTIASLVMSLESVFSVIGGWVILHQNLSVREYIGCVLVFIAVILAQLKFSKKKEKGLG